MSQAFPPNSTISHYRIVSQIGAGGMGEVYLAEDSRLHRKVALKILPAEMAANQDRMRRFKQEATAAAALNHPNIAHIYEIGESEGTNFIAMEFVEGVTLRQKIHRERTELTFQTRDWELFRLNADPYWSSLRDDQRFKELLKRLNLPE
ncbi:MAG TPA: protein kinase [Pyrinomonadaceae bacterium]|nr:protein kinase [Pyrinomonadaceae bacterium]